MHDFRKLDVWISAHRLAKDVYFASKKLRGWDNFTLRDQLFRAALSVPSNIVEGRGHKSDREFARFLRIAFASAMEVEYQIFFANDVEVLSAADFQSLNNQVVQVKKMLTGLIKRLDEPQALPKRGRRLKSR
jgi:four helix bundle protein